MLILLAAAALVAPAPDPLPNPSRAPARCERGVEKAAAAGPARLRKLDEMPPAQEIKAVWRFDQNGCPTPVVVRARVDSKGR